MNELNYEMVEYSKEFATATAGLDAYELDILLILTYLARQKVHNMEVDTEKDLEISLSSKELKKILRYTGSANPRRIGKVVKKLFDTKYYFKRDKYIVAHHIFEELCFNVDTDEVILKLKKNYINLFFRLSGNFTQHKILEFNSLKGKYAKKLYQIIMSYKNFQSWELDVNIFRVILEIPKSYGWGDIDKCLKPVIREFKEKTEIKNFKIEKIKEGRIISKIKFSWDFKDDEEEVIQEEKKEEIKSLNSEIQDSKLTDVEIEVLEWIFNTFPDKYTKPPIPKTSPLYVKVMRGIINNFTGEKED